MNSRARTHDCRSRAVRAAPVATVQFSRTVERRLRRPILAYSATSSFDMSHEHRRTPVSQNSTACWTCCGRLPRSPPSSRGRGPRGGHPARFGRHARPGPLTSHGLRAGDRMGPSRDGPRTGARNVLPRKEVIQPQLPLRLPCYDFTPVTSPTFDGSLPCGLGHRLRVLLTPVV